MSNKTIAKFSVFVIPAVLLWAVASGCGFVRSDPGDVPSTARYGPPKIVGTIASSDITESSGIAASRCQSGLFWTHNDSGDEAFIYAFDVAGTSLGTWKVANAENRDWEDIAAAKDAKGKCYLYIGEIGDNKLLWPQHHIYRIEEPLVVPDQRSSNRERPQITSPAEILTYSYPDGDRDAETLMVHPLSGNIYIVSKQVSGEAGVYRLKAEFQAGVVQSAVRVASISVPAVPNGLLTGGDISPDGKRVIVCDYRQAYEFVLPEAGADFDLIWKEKPLPVDVGKQKNGEAICYSVDGTSLFTTSEGRNSPIIEVRRLQ